MHGKCHRLRSYRSLDLCTGVVRAEYRYACHRTAIVCFKGQLHVAVVIVIPDVFAGIMHTQETHETDGVIQFAVLYEMLYQAG